MLRNIARNVAVHHDCPSDGSPSLIPTFLTDKHLAGEKPKAPLDGVFAFSARQIGSAYGAKHGGYITSFGGCCPMPFLILTKIPSSRSAERDSLRSEHRAYLDGQASLILAAGATLSDDGVGSDGSFFLVALETREEAQRFIDGDPYTKNGLIESMTFVQVRKGYFNCRREL